MKYASFLSILTIAALSLCHQAYAQTPQTPEPPRAVWIEPVQTQASWFNPRSLQCELNDVEIISTGHHLAFMNLPNPARNYYVVNENFEILGTIPVPEDVFYFGLDSSDRVFYYNGHTLRVANTWQDAAAPEGYTDILDIPDSVTMDIAGNTLAYADSAKLTLIDLSSGSMKQIPLADFFNDDKVAAMTPEAVQAAEEAAAKGKKKSKTAKPAKKADAGDTPLQVADIHGIWWRADGIGVIRVRSLTNLRTFVTRDNGKSWSIDANAPQNIEHSFGWIWDGQDKVLSRDGKTWVKKCGRKVNLADRWVLAHRVQPTENLKGTPLEHWTDLPSPEQPQTTEESAENAENAEMAEICSDENLPAIPAERASVAPEMVTPSTAYTIDEYDNGFGFGLINHAQTDGDPNQAQPTIWIMRPDVHQLEFLPAPQDCTRPVYADSKAGIGVLLCEKAPNEPIVAYTLTANAEGISDWVPETLLGEQFAQQNQNFKVLSSPRELMAAKDGTLILTGDCLEEYGPAPELTEEEKALGMAQHEPPVIHACYYAVRNPDESIPTNERWRIERVQNATGVGALSGARMLSVEDHGDPQAQSLVLRTALATETIVDAFDPTPYQGLVETNEGCLALYDGSVPASDLANAQSGHVNPETGEYVPASNVKLLSVNGKLAGIDCASSRQIVESGMGQTEIYEEPAGDARFGVRLGGGAMLSTHDVITWVMRVEGIIPVYRGKYEVGLLYRMAGGNVSSATGHMGMVNMRWRYDELEKFDFAAGAGIGFGQACGYDKASDKNATDNDESTKPSAFKECNELSMRYLITGIAAYKLSSQWKIYIAAEMLGGTSWGVDLNGGIEIRF